MQTQLNMQSGYLAHDIALYNIALGGIIVGSITPDLVMLPGTKGMVGHDDYGFHLRAHMRALKWLTIPSAVVALLVVLWPSRTAVAS